MLEGLNLGYGLNNYNGLNHFGMIDLMGDLGTGMGMPFPGTPDYGLVADASSPHVHGAMKRRVRIALARLPHAGGEGGEWDVLEVAA